MKYFALLLITPLFILLAIFGGFWWIFPETPNEKFGSAIFIICLWVWVINDLPKKGWKACMEDRFNIRFVLPLAVLSTIGYVVGFFIKR